MYCDAVDVGVVDKPNDLVREQLAVVLRRQVRFRRLGAVELKSLADTFSQHVQSRVGFHDLSHRLLDQWLTAREPVAKRTVEHTHDYV